MSKTDNVTDNQAAQKCLANLPGENRNPVLGDITPQTKDLEALAASEVRYRRLFESAKDGILILDAETGLVMDVNPFLIELLGLAREEFLGKEIWQLGLFADIVANQESFRELQQKEYIRYEDKPLRTADGRKVDVEFVSNVYQANGLRVIQCNIREITERKRVTEALRNSQQFIEGIINAIPARVFWKDTNHVFLGCNRAFASDAGFDDPKEVIGKDDYQMPWRDQADLYRQDDDAVIEKGLPLLNREEPQTTPTGITLTLLTSKVPLRDSAGNNSGILGTYMDITGTRQTEAARTLLAAAVEQSAETIVITDAAATILYANPAFEKITGYSREEAIGKNPRLLKSGRHDAEFYRTMWETLRRGETWAGRMINKRKDGAFYEEEAVISPVHDATGKIINYVGVKRDVTREAHLENELRQAQKMEAVGRLAGGVAHDFNNLLMGIMGFTELCLDELASDSPIREWLNEIIRAADRSAEITRQLLAFARRQIAAPKILNLNDAVSGMLKLLGRLIGENIKLVWIPGSELRPIKIDPSQVDQILANLCLNARDAIAGVGTITLQTENITLDAACSAIHTEATPGPYVLLSVRDDGCGMDRETLEHIFEPFFSTKGVGQGTGLGLATVYGIVKQNQGFIYADSESGKGATFTLYLPQAADADKTPAGPVKANVPRGRGETILLVEDEKSLRTTCSLSLDSLGYKVLLAESPHDALMLAEQHPGGIDLLLTDVVMPGMSGKELANRLVSVTPSQKILFMSGYPGEIMAKQGLLETRSPFIAKPFSRIDLARKVREVLDGKDSGPSMGL
jgi:PAS domain S-box-containing protein